MKSRRPSTSDQSVGEHGILQRRPSRHTHRPTSCCRYAVISFLWLLGLLVLALWCILNATISTMQLHEETSRVASFERRATPSQSRLRMMTTTTMTTKTMTIPTRLQLPPSIWSTHKLAKATNISSWLSANEIEHALSLCGKLFYSSLHRAARVRGTSEDVFFSTGDIGHMWTRDSVVQISLYINHHEDKPWLRLLLEGAIRRNAFYILQDPYANAYNYEWKDPEKLTMKERVIGRGGFVATKNYELDSGAYFLNLLYDYYVADDMFRPEALLLETVVFEAVMLLVETWIVEQHHEEMSPYRYFELPRQGLGTPTNYTGMTWSGFRPSDDACKYHYLVPSNIHVAAALERTLVVNRDIWKHSGLETKASTLLADIEKGVNEFGILTDSSGTRIYAYEVDGLGGMLESFDDANVPSLLSIPLLGWSGYDHDVYRATREKILGARNPNYFEGTDVRGIGSPHTGKQTVWPMAMLIQGLTEEGEGREERMAFQMKQLLLSSQKDTMHESVKANNVNRFTRNWFEWANALFVLYVEATLGARCDVIGSTKGKKQIAMKMGKFARGNTTAKSSLYFSDPYENDPTLPEHYQGEMASVRYDTLSEELEREIKMHVASTAEGTAGKSVDKATQAKGKMPGPGQRSPFNHVPIMPTIPATKSS